MSSIKCVEVPGYQVRAVVVERNKVFRIIDVEGCQIADMFVVASADNSEFFSPAMTRQVSFRVVPGPGDMLYSNRRRPMLTFVSDTSPGRHDMSFAPCDQGFYVDLGADSSHPNCLDNYLAAPAAMELSLEFVPDPFNLFQNSVPNVEGGYDLGPALSRAGDHVEFKTEMDVVLIVSACSADLPIDGIEPIGGVSTPIRIEVL